jgi:Flp pilus assembly CpaE family ATPase
MAGVKVERCIQELLKSGGEMDTFRFNNAVIAPYTGPHMLLSSDACTATPFLPAWEDYFRLLEILRTRYDHILVDLPELVNPGTREIVQRSRFVFTVATPELLSLELAGRRMRELAAWRVPKDRIRVLLNRFQRGGLNSADVTKHLDCLVAQVFPNDYPEVNRAVGLGGPVPAYTALGQRFADFAASLLDTPPARPATPVPLSALFRRLLPTLPGN